MNVKTLCLAILHDDDASGYEIRKLSAEGEYAYFVVASFGSIYPALAKLEDEGFVQSKVEHQEGRPAKKVYSITEAGREAFRETLFDDLSEDVFRSEFLLFARFAHMVPASLVETRLNERIARIDAEIGHIEKMMESNDKPGDMWIGRHGIKCLSGARDDIKAHMHELIALALPDEKTVEAAE